MSLLLRNMMGTSVIVWWGGVSISYSLSEQRTVFMIMKILYRPASGVMLGALC